jgi:hypothetical protein
MIQLSIPQQRKTAKSEMTNQGDCFVKSASKYNSIRNSEKPKFGSKAIMIHINGGLLQIS